MLRKRLANILGLMTVLVMVLSACGPAATAVPPTADAPTEVATAAPTEQPPTTRKGGWLDEIDVSVVDAESAITQVQAEAIDLYSFNLASKDFPAIRESGLSYTASYGGNYAIMFNPAVFTDANVLNPFSDRKIREAVNWLIDRNYVNQEIYAGGSLPKFFTITTQLVDYTALVDVARSLEAKYAYNLDKAKEAISAQMTSLGATQAADGKWQFNGAPVSLIFIIRSDGDGTRKPLGDYVATQLESVGFTVDRQYKTSSEASPIWIGSDPLDGQWHLYTAGWLSPGLTRDEKGQFQQMYAPSSQQGLSIFLANTAIDPEFLKVSDDLANAAFTTLEQRHDLMARALELSMQDSLQVWVVDQQSYSPFNDNVQVTYDLASGMEAAAMYPYNLRFKDQEGGQMKIGTSDLFTEPWNTVGGSNWIWDTAVMRATTQGSDFAAAGGIMGDPYTGLAWPQRIATAEVTAQTGLPVSATHDWVTLKTADTIAVPDDAWADWDTEAQTWITAKDRAAAATSDPDGPDGGYTQTAKIKSVVTYPADLFDTIKWHDGSPLSVADFIMPTIIFFDRANPDSPIYDEASVPYFQSVKSYFKGFRITSTDPLTIESYSDLYYSDAELDVSSGWPGSAYGLSGENSWNVLAVSNLAEAAGELAYTPDKADALKVEHMSWIGGPSLDILSKYLDQAESESLIPYEPALGQYITAEEAKARYSNLKAWYATHKHFWVGTGPYFLDQVFTTEKSAVLKNNPDFPDLADRWSSFSTPKLATAQLDGPGQVKAGDEATFDVAVMFNADPYPQADISQVKYLLYDADNALVASGEATAVADGQYQVVLTPDVTSKLTAGSYKLEVAVVPTPVAIPAFSSIEFVVTE